MLLMPCDSALLQGNSVTHIVEGVMLREIRDIYGEEKSRVD